MRERGGVRRQASVRVDGAKRLRRSRSSAAGSVARVSVSRRRGDAPDRRPARVPVRVHEDQTIPVVAAQRLACFSLLLVYISEPLAGTLMKHESLSARARSVRDSARITGSDADNAGKRWI